MKRVALIVFAAGCAGTPYADPEVEAELTRAPPTGCDVRVPADEPTVQAGIDATPDGGKLCIANGTYTENLVIEDRTLTIEGRGPRTVLDGGGLASTVDVLVGDGVDFVALKITGGHTTDSGGGVVLSEAGAVSFTDVVFDGNAADGAGGALSAIHTTVTLDGVRFTHNHARAGGAVYLGEAGFDAHDVAIVGNTADDGSGGGIACGRSYLGLRNSTIQGNRALGTYANGGGFDEYNCGGGLWNTVLAGNRSDVRGGGASLGGYGDYTLENVVVAGNHASEGGAGVLVSSQGFTGVFTNTAIVRNRSTTGVGGVQVDEYAGAVFTYSDLWGNPGGDVGGVVDPVGTDGNVSVAPKFVAFTSGTPRTWDFHLRADSPLVDAGDPELLDPDGSRSDIGTYGGPGAE